MRYYVISGTDSDGKKLFLSAIGMDNFNKALLFKNALNVRMIRKLIRNGFNSLGLNKYINFKVEIARIKKPKEDRIVTKFTPELKSDIKALYNEIMPLGHELLACKDDPEKQERFEEIKANLLEIQERIYSQYLAWSNAPDAES